jgi:glycosyltransferase involved in cell wall biosynthesis
MVKVSVVIPSYNCMAYLPATLESILKQTFTDFEVLIINDGSTDNILEWLKKITDSRIRVISQENQGLAGARNTGIANSNGEYIAFVDADDLWAPTKLEKQVHCLEKNQEVGLVHTWMLLIDEKGKSTGRVLHSHAEGNAWKEVIVKNVIACPSVMIRRCCFEKVGFFEPSHNPVEDWDMWIRIASNYPLAVIKEPLAYYRQVPGSMSRNWQAMEEGFKLTIEKAFALVPQELMYLKNYSYSYANTCLAWKALQSKNCDLSQANKFRKLAYQYHPKLIFSLEYIRLSVAIFIFKLLGQDSYNKISQLAHVIRRRISHPI